MATTQDLSELKYKAELTITMDGISEPFTVEFEKNLSDSTYLDKRIVNVGTSQTTIAKIDPDESTGQAWRPDLIWIRNLDDTNFVRVRFYDNGAHALDIKLNAGESRLFYLDDLNVSESEANFVSFSNIDFIAVEADTAACDVEILMAAQ